MASIPTTVANGYYKYLPYSCSTETRVYRFPTSTDKACVELANPEVVNIPPPF